MQCSSKSHFLIIIEITLFRGQITYPIPNSLNKRCQKIAFLANVKITARAQLWLTCKSEPETVTLKH